MALADFHTDRPAKSGRGLLARIFDGLVNIAENNHRVRRVKQLNALSDEELARRGLTRDQIARHVFRDVMYI